MPTRTADAVWNGGLIEGNGTLKTGSGALSVPYTWKARAEDGSGTNPEELIAAAHAGCYSMAFSFILANAGFKSKTIQTSAKVAFEKVGDGFSITKIDLTTVAEIPGIDDAKFQELAKAAKDGCPVSKALSATPISISATLKK